jgi:peroxiredoxin Q/BCP
MTSPRDDTRVVVAGERAPEFSLPAHPRGPIALADFRGTRIVVLVFYFWDEGPGSVRDLRALDEARPEFRRAGAEVLAVSTDTLASHAHLADRHAITVPLLADVDREVGRAYGAVRGDRYRADRLTVVIDRDGFVRDVSGNRPDVEELLALVRALAQ